MSAPNTIASDTLVEAIARALCEQHIREVRQWDTDPRKLKRMLPKAVDYSWTDFVDRATTALTAITEAGCTIVSKDGLHELLRAANDAREALDNGTRYERGAGGMTIDAQIARTVINNVPARVVEPLHLAIVNLEGATNNGKAE